jgi:hypothetical protein
MSYRLVSQQINAMGSHTVDYHNYGKQKDRWGLARDAVQTTRDA